ncbi:DEAD/DEAH box helicase domain [Trinorchestia longiramus]|nr:DEAD/DEAH box helicase domain [Trinorchestia longiramus]
MEEDSTTFKDLGLIDELCEACEKMKWVRPTKIQKEAIPVALKGKDVVGIAETGSGKTGAFGLPILQALLLKPQRMFALILTPTRELAIQIKEQLDDLGRDFGLSCMAVVGGIDMTQQALMLLKNPHIIVATLGRIVDHLKHLKGFSLSSIKYLVMDEADRILNLDFEEEVDRIVRSLPKQRTTMLFSATITNKVQQLQRAHLKNAVKVEVNRCYKLVSTLKQYMIAVPFIDRHAYLLQVMQQLKKTPMIVFCNTRANTIKTALILREFGHKAVPLYGDMSQTKRIEALEKFKQQERSILVATNVASRGLDIPCVDYVLNLEVPTSSDDYVHRVGRTARAGRSGVAITFVSQFEVEDFLRIESVVLQGDGNMPVFPTDKNEVEKLTQRVIAAENSAKAELQRIEEAKKISRGELSDDDTEEANRVRKRLKKAETAEKKTKKFIVKTKKPVKAKRK